MTADIMLEGHVANTIERALLSEGEYLIAAQDTTYYNYSGHQKTEGLGEIQGKVKGIIQHNVLLINELGQCLGLLDQQYWTRKGAKDFEGKESLKWKNGLEAIHKHLGGIDKKVVSVEDREADIFDFFKAERASSVELLVRVHQVRNIEVVAHHTIAKLDSIGKYLKDFGRQQVLIQRNNREVRLILSLKAGGVNVLPNKDLSACKHKAQGLSLVIAEEIACWDVQTGADVFKEQDKAVWYLLTSLPIENRAEVERVVYFYALRWRIERLHYLLKSGALQVEKLQFDDINTLINALSFYSIVAWQILALSYLVRQNADAPATSVFEAYEIAILEQTSQKTIRTVREAVLGLAKIVGFAPSKKRPFPGAKVLAQALERFHFIKIGASLNKAKPLQH